MSERLLWELRCERDGFSVDAAIAKSRPLPEWYLKEPVLVDGDYFYLKAFSELSTGRQIGAMGGVGPISWRDLRDFASEAGLEPDVAAGFYIVMRSMDDAYLEYQAEESRKKSGEKGKRGT